MTPPLSPNCLTLSATVSIMPVVLMISNLIFLFKSLTTPVNELTSKSNEFLLMEIVWLTDVSYKFNVAFHLMTSDCNAPMTSDRLSVVIVADSSGSILDMALI